MRVRGRYIVRPLYNRPNGRARASGHAQRSYVVPVEGEESFGRVKECR